MGVGPFPRKSCYTNAAVAAPNPSPDKWELIRIEEFDNSHVMAVRYIGCTNFEGIKVMVFKGRYEHRPVLDPHFSEDDTSPFARFEPTDDGWLAARLLAKSL